MRYFPESTVNCQAVDIVCLNSITSARNVIYNGHKGMQVRKQDRENNKKVKVRCIRDEGIMQGYRDNSQAGS